MIETFTGIYDTVVSSNMLAVGSSYRYATRVTLDYRKLGQDMIYENTISH